MKTQWEFYFEAKGIIFQKEYSFVGRATPKCADVGHAKPVEFQLRLVPDNELMTPSIDDAGRILITLPGTPDATESLTQEILFGAKEQIEFPHAQITVLGGLILAKKIAENEQEEKEIGDHPYSGRLEFEEMPRYHPEFDPGRLTGMRAATDYLPVLAQYNLAKLLQSPVDRFLGFFKVLEKAHAPGRGGNLLKALRANDALWNLARKVVFESASKKYLTNRNRFNELLKKLVRVRDNCAHLRGQTGYSPGDPRIRTEVEPYLEMVSALALAAVEEKSQRDIQKAHSKPLQPTDKKRRS